MANKSYVSIRRHGDTTQKRILESNFKTDCSLTLFRIGLCSQMRRKQKGSPSPKPVTYICYHGETWHNYTLSKEDPKSIWITWNLWNTPWVLLTSLFFHRKLVTFVISRNTDIDCILIHKKSNSFTFFESLKVVLINMVVILMMSAKLAALGFLKIKVFWNKGYDVIISVHDIVTNKILLCGSNDIVDVVIWLNFGSSNISKREVIIISIL